jgi:uncharacterized protein (DUF1778 family)
MPKALRLRKRTEDILTAPLSVVLTVGERETVREAARLSEQSVSAFIRAAAVKAAQRVAKQTMKALDRAA